jgi:hypothetical protein
MESLKTAICITIVTETVTDKVCSEDFVQMETTMMLMLQKH